MYIINAAFFIKTILIAAMVTALLGCQEPESVISDAEFAAFRENHPGMLQTCLDEVRYGGYVASRPNDPTCYEMLPAERWSGLWEHGWEWTNFCPEPAQTCDWTATRGTWLTFADDVQPEPNMQDGIHRIEFIGRQTAVPGNFGHMGSYKYLMVVDRIISLVPIETAR